jgi:cell division ATPase FtsA
LEEAENIKIGAHISSYSKKKIDEIISARLSDMFELIENHLKKIGRNGLLPAGIFLLGGGSNVNGVEDFARNILKLPSKLAVISGANDKNLIKDSSLAIAYGLCNLGFSREEKTNLGIKNKVGKSTEMVFGWIKRFLP